MKHVRSWPKAQGTRALHQHLEEHLYFTSLTGTKEATQGHKPSYSHRGHRLSNLGTHTCINARTHVHPDGQTHPPPMHTHTWVYTHMHTHQHTLAATHLHKPPGNHIHTHNLTCMQSATCPVTCVHAKSSHTHTHTHTSVRQGALKHQDTLHTVQAGAFIPVPQASRQTTPQDCSHAGDRGDDHSRRHGAAAHVHTHSHKEPPPLSLQRVF